MGGVEGRRELVRGSRSMHKPTVTDPGLTGQHQGGAGWEGVGGMRHMEVKKELHTRVG